MARLEGLAGPVQMAMAAVVVAVTVYGNWPVFGMPDQTPEAVADRLAFVLSWMLVPALCLFNGLGAAHFQRVTNPLAGDGQRQGAGRFLEIILRYNINTLEQSFLALIVWCGLALRLAPEDLDLIPRLAVLFGAGRVLFFWGYLWTPAARVFGMGLTAYPSYAALIWLLWQSLATS
jgi:hypothetical protein